jgi:hypothetical protein
MGVAYGDQPLNSPLSDTRLASHIGKTKVTFTLGADESIGASATAAAFPGDFVGSH